MNRLARARPSAGRTPAPTAETILEIKEVGARGDGLAMAADGPIYAPLTLPGERVRARLSGARAELLAVETASPERVAAPCAHFGACGGCQLQHWAEGPYLAWKQALVGEALARRGIAAAVEPIRPAWGEGRRRAAFHASRAGGRLAFGFIERGGARIEPIETCVVLAPALAAALPALREIARLFAPERGEITLHCLASETGVDCDVKGARAPDRALREAGARAAAPLARLSLDGEPLAQRRVPIVAMGGARVAPPPGAFLQPTARGEAILADLACEAVSGAAHVADLFCGIGTFALRLSAQARVHALDSEAAMLAALKAAIDARAGGKAVQATRRDLLRTPLSALELKHYDAAVFDPPRSGARLQAAEIAKSKVAKVAAVSCDPATFARDARALIDGGFTLRRVTPVDQFRWSPHLEVVGAFER